MAGGPGVLSTPMTSVTNVERGATIPMTAGTGEVVGPMEAAVEIGPDPGRHLVKFKVSKIFCTFASLNQP